MSLAELQEACLERGLEIADLAKEQLRGELTEWLEIVGSGPDGHRKAVNLFVYAHGFVFTSLRLTPSHAIDQNADS